MQENEQLILQIMKESKCYGQENMITPSALIQKCAAKGLSNSKVVEAAIVSLIDQDVVEYEMDANLQTSELWLL
jgi:hypothetical protein